MLLNEEGSNAVVAADCEAAAVEDDDRLLRVGAIHSECGAQRNRAAGGAGLGDVDRVRAGRAGDAAAGGGIGVGGGDGVGQAAAGVHRDRRAGDGNRGRKDPDKGYNQGNGDASHRRISSGVCCAQSQLPCVVT